VLQGLGLGAAESQHVAHLYGVVDLVDAVVEGRMEIVGTFVVVGSHDQDVSHTHPLDSGFRMFVATVPDGKVDRKRRTTALAVGPDPFQLVHKPLALAQRPESVQTRV